MARPKVEAAAVPRTAFSSAGSASPPLFRCGLQYPVHSWSCLSGRHHWRRSDHAALPLSPVERVHRRPLMKDTQETSVVLRSRHPRTRMIVPPRLTPFPPFNCRVPLLLCTPGAPRPAPRHITPPREGHTTGRQPRHAATKRRKTQTHTRPRQRVAIIRSRGGGAVESSCPASPSASAAARCRGLRSDDEWVVVNSTTHRKARRLQSIGIK